MKYKLMFNIPSEEHATEITIDGEQMKRLSAVLGQKGMVVEINGSFFNTSYFVKAVPDAEANRLEQGELLQLGQTTQTQQDKNTRQAIEELKKKLFDKKIISKIKR